MGLRTHGDGRLGGREAAHWPGYGGFHGECLRRVGRLDEARAHCLAALEDVEKSDHMFRDTNRVVSLVALGRTALQQHDTSAARAAYGQAIAHVRGRQRTLAGGCLLVQALAGLTRADDDPAPYAEAVHVHQCRDRWDFSAYWMCEEGTTLMDLARAAWSLGREDEARKWLSAATERDCFEAQGGLP